MKVRPGRFIVIAVILSLLAFGFYSAGNVIFAEKPNFTSGSGYEENDEEEVEEETQGEVPAEEEEVEEDNTASASGYEAESDTVAAAVLGQVDRQDVTPGTQQTGHMNIDGTGLFGKVKVSGDSGTSGLTGVDMEHTGTNPRKWRVGAQGSQLKGSFAITDITTSEVNPKYRLTINKFGKVGIGTKRPKEKLHVNGNVKANNFIGNGSGLTGVITTETDPVFGGSAASGITAPQIANWNTCYSWGDHTIPGYLTGYTETDPVFGGSPAFGISGADITNWNTVGDWGELTGIPADIADGDQVGILAESDPQVGANTLNYVPRWDGSALVTGTIFDNGTRIGIGTTTPSYPLDMILSGAGSDPAFVRVRSTNANGYAGIIIDRLSNLDNSYVLFKTSNMNKWSCGMMTDGDEDFEISRTYSGDGTFHINHSNGDVGIGDTTPDGKLEVRQTGTADIFNLYDNTTNVFTVEDGGDVGIGTNNPYYKLDVQAGESGYAARIYNDNNVSGGTAGISAEGDAQGTGSSTGYGGRFTGRGGTTSGGAYGTQNFAYAYGSNPAYGVYSDADGGTTTGKKWAFYGLGDGYISGDVGIGDTTPDGKLEVRQTGTADIFNLYDNTTNVFTVEDGGNVGIGTMGPSEKLHINGGKFLIYDTDSTMDTDGFSGLKMQYYRGSGEGAIMSAYDSGQGFLTFYTNTGGAAAVERMRIDRNGNVGIGDTSPDYKLDVNGTAYATGAAGALSDIRHKKNVQPVSDGALDIIDNLRPVTYEWKEPVDSGMEGAQIGFIAQEVEKILPEVVLTQDDEEKTKGLKYTEFIPVIVKAMQEIRKVNEALKAENVAMKQAVKELDSKVEQSESDNIALKAENEQLRENLLAMGSRLDAIETMMLAGTTIQREKLAKLEH